MSEAKGLFDDAIRILHEAKGEAILVDEELIERQLEVAIRVLENFASQGKKLSVKSRERKGEKMIFYLLGCFIGGSVLGSFLMKRKQKKEISKLEDSLSYWRSINYETKRFHERHLT